MMILLIDYSSQQNAVLSKHCSFHQNAKVSNLILFRNFTPSQPGLLYQGLKNGKKRRRKKRKEKCTAGADYI